MAAKNHIDAFKKFAADRQAALSGNDIISVIQKDPSFKKYTEAVRNQMIDDAVVKIKAEYADRLAKLRSGIGPEARDKRVEVDKVKYPKRTSTSTFTREDGQRQQLIALQFLATKPTNERIIEEMRGAMDRGDVDTAFTLKDNIFNDVKYLAPGVPAFTEPQKALNAEINKVFSTFDGMKKIGEIEAELNEYATADKIGAEFENSAAAGAMQSIELLKLLPESEQRVMVEGSIAEQNQDEITDLKSELHKVTQGAVS